MKCKKDCDYLGYTYTTDDLGYILGFSDYLCTKYNQILDRDINRCPKCIDADKSRNSFKNKDKKLFK